MVFKPNPLDALLAHDISSRKEDLDKAASAIALDRSGAVAKIHSRGYRLCQDRPLRKLELIPVKRYAISRGTVGEVDGQ